MKGEFGGDCDFRMSDGWDGGSWSADGYIYTSE